jgi:hypothetical protein
VDPKDFFQIRIDNFFCRIRIRIRILRIIFHMYGIREPVKQKKCFFFIEKYAFCSLSSVQHLIFLIIFIL